MTRSRIAGTVAALAAALSLVAVYLVAGGTRFTPMAVASPCTAQPTPRPGADLDRLAQALVLMASRSAACTLGVSREELLIALPEPQDREALLRRSGKSEQELEAALRAGLLASVDRLTEADALPSSSQLLDAYKTQLGLPSAAVGIIDSIPDDTLDQTVPVPEIVRDAATRLDPGELLDHLGDEDALERDLTTAIRDATLAQVRTAIQDQAGGFLRGLLG